MHGEGVSSHHPCTPDPELLSLSHSPVPLCAPWCNRMMSHEFMAAVVPEPDLGTCIQSSCLHCINAFSCSEHGGAALCQHRWSNLCA